MAPSLTDRVARAPNSLSENGTPARRLHGCVRATLSLELRTDVAVSPPPSQILRVLSAARTAEGDVSALRQVSARPAAEERDLYARCLPSRSACGPWLTPVRPQPNSVQSSSNRAGKAFRTSSRACYTSVRARGRAGLTDGPLHTAAFCSTPSSPARRWSRTSCCILRDTCRFRPSQLCFESLVPLRDVISP